MKRLILLLALCSAAFSQTAQFPGSVVTDSQLGVAADNITTTLAAGIGTTDTTIFLQSTAGMPVNGILTLGGPGGEQVQICAVASGSVTIGHSSCPGTDGRGFAGTTPTAYGAGTFAAMLVNAWYINATNQELIKVENALGANLSHLTTGTVTSVVAGCGLGGGTITNSGVLSATQTPFYVSNSGYNFAGNCGNFVVRTNAGSMSDTLPQAGSSPWPSGAWMDIQNNGPGTETITPTASQINGHASLVLVSGQGAHIFSDGVNFYALVTGAGTGTVSSVGSGCGLSGGPITGSGTLAASEGSNPQSGGTYTFAGSDCGKIVTRTYSGAASDTLPQATGSFAAGWWMDVQNNGTGAETITPTTSTINGHATLVLQAGQGTHIVSDGTNYQAAAGSSSSAAGLPAGSQGQRLQIATNTGNATTLTWSSPATLSAGDYNFSQQPGGSLSAGSNTITLAPCPLGVSGSATNLQLYLSGGTGTAEVVPVTGGTCAGDGLTTGTVVVTVAACGGGTCHSGSWTIGSMSSGILEAVNSLPSQGGVVQLPAGIWPLYGPILISRDNATLVGQASGWSPSFLCHPESGGFYCMSPSVLQATGTWASGSYMVTWDGSGQSRKYLINGGARDLDFNANGLASGEIHVKHINGGDFWNLHLHDHTNSSGTSYGFYFESDNNSTAGTTTTCGNNGGFVNIDSIEVQSYRVGAAGIQIGVPGTTYDVCSNRIRNVAVETYATPGTYGLWMANTDTNTISNFYSEEFGGGVLVQSITTDSSSPPVATIHANGHGIPPGATAAGVLLIGVTNSSGTCPGSGEFGPLEGPALVNYVDANTLTITSKIPATLTANATYCASITMRGVDLVIGGGVTQGNTIDNVTGSIAIQATSNLDANTIAGWNWSSDNNGGDANYARIATLGAYFPMVNGRSGYFAGPMIASPQTIVPFQSLIDTSRAIPSPGQTSGYTTMRMANNTDIEAAPVDGSSNTIVMVGNDINNNLYLGSTFGVGGNTNINAPSGNGIHLQVGTGSPAALYGPNGDLNVPSSLRTGVKTYSALNSATPCSGLTEGAMEAISDSPTSTWGAAVTSGLGTNHVQLYCNGTHWYVNGTNVSGGSGSMTWPAGAGLAVYAGGSAWGTSLSPTAPVFTGIVTGGSTAAPTGGGFLVPNDVFYQGKTTGGAAKSLVGIGTSNQTVFGSAAYYSFYDNTPTEIAHFSAGAAGSSFIGPLSSASSLQANSTGAVAFLTLPACSGTTEGTQFAVADSTSAAGGATITGGGSLHVMAYCNGTNWIVAAGSVTLGAVNPQTTTYAATTADFANFKTISVASGTFTITLVASGSQPANGQFINILNYGTGVVTISPSGQNINGGGSSLTLPASSATSPASATVWSDGSNYFASTMNVGGGSGASATYQLTDLNVTRTSATVLTIGAGCGSTTPCNIGFNGTTYSITSSATVTHSGTSSDTAYVYVTSAGTITVGYNTNADATCSGCATVSGTSFPAGSVRLWTWTSTSGTWDSTGGADKRAFDSQKVITAGAGIVYTPGGTSDTVAMDAAVVPSYITATGTYTFPTSSTTANGACSPDQTLTLTGAAANDAVILGLPTTFPSGWTGTAFVSAANTIKLRMCNFSGGAASISSSTYRATVINP